MKMTKLFFGNLTKEEQWINQQVSTGQKLISVEGGMRYKFEPEKDDNSCRHDVRIDYRTFKRQSEFFDYVLLFEDAGWKHISVKYICLCIVFKSNGYAGFQFNFHYKDWYLTPGLWQMKGEHFWRAFLFETPFVILREFTGFIIGAIILVYLVLWIKALVQYKKEKKACQ